MARILVVAAVFSVAVSARLSGARLVAEGNSEETKTVYVTDYIPMATHHHHHHRMRYSVGKHSGQGRLADAREERAYQEDVYEVHPDPEGGYKAHIHPAKECEVHPDPDSDHKACIHPAKAHEAHQYPAKAHNAHQHPVRAPAKSPKYAEAAGSKDEEDEEPGYRHGQHAVRKPRPAGGRPSHHAQAALPAPTHPAQADAERAFSSALMDPEMNPAGDNFSSVLLSLIEANSGNMPVVSV
ncbi:hypothetical protein H4R18_005214 [Coemansia javaensis]|uniref:Uncharacterized protein n=1 Tax=Coemansia javaensis TaxID=2761396 RepID=A0A9W8H734_9FUNG|nr:hypothetical protein H4R18_005214 [Coemansia javaensis]